MTVIELCETIGAPPDVVWQAIERVEDHGRWMFDAARITPRGEPGRGVGDQFDCFTRVGPLSTNDRFTVTEWEPGARMGIVHEGAVTGHASFVLTPAGTATRFCWREELTFPWWMGGAVGGEVARLVLRPVWRANLRRLAALVEAGTATGGAGGV